MNAGPAVTRCRRIATAILVALVTAAMPATGQAQAATAGPVWIVTEGEASLPSPPGARGTTPLPQNGPVIKVERPDGNTPLAPPFAVDVVFEPRATGAAVKMDTLKIVYLKVVELEITDRFRPYIKGTRLFVENANVPSGRHRLRISIADGEGNLTAEVLQFVVK
jgi:hypothetical protein